MQTTGTTSSLTPEMRDFAAPSLAGQDGRLGIVVDGTQLVSVEVANGRGIFSQSTGATRATLICRSVEGLTQILNGRLNMVVAALRGEVTVRGDAPFAIRVLRAINANAAAAPTTHVTHGG